MGFGELEAIGITGSGVAVDVRSAGIGKPHHLGTLVEGFAGSVVDGAAENLHIVVVLHEDNLRVAARYEQAEEGVFGHGVGLLAAYEVGEDVAVEMVHIDDGDAQSE